MSTETSNNNNNDSNKGSKPRINRKEMIAKIIAYKKAGNFTQALKLKEAMNRK